MVLLGIILRRPKPSDFMQAVALTACVSLLLAGVLWFLGVPLRLSPQLPLLFAIAWYALSQAMGIHVQQGARHMLLLGSGCIVAGLIGHLVGALL